MSRIHAFGLAASPAALGNARVGGVPIDLRPFVCTVTREPFQAEPCDDRQAGTSP